MKEMCKGSKVNLLPIFIQFKTTRQGIKLIAFSFPFLFGVFFTYPKKVYQKICYSKIV